MDWCGSWTVHSIPFQRALITYFSSPLLWCVYHLWNQYERHQQCIQVRRTPFNAHWRSGCSFQALWRRNKREKETGVIMTSFQLHVYMWFVFACNNAWRVSDRKLFYQQKRNEFDICVLFEYFIAMFLR